MKACLLAMVSALALLPPASGQAWGGKAHAAVGVLAVEQSSPAVRAELTSILDSMDPQRIGSACDWPDKIKDAGLADWSIPLHYVNLDLAATAYSRRRDCAAGNCVPEAVQLYAQRLGDESLGRVERKEAFAYLCHFVADLHQPLHVSYADDKGGSLVTISWRGSEQNLHWWWDFTLIDARVGDWPELAQLLRERRNRKEPPWTPADVSTWTNETYTFMRHSAYPAQRTIDAEFEAHAWQVILQQLDAAAARLTVVLEAELGDR